MKRRIAVRAIIAKDNKLLCVKLKPYNKAITGEFWCTVGGGVDECESLIPALHREVIEETGITPVIGSLLYVQQFKNEIEHLEFFFHITNTDDFIDIDLTQSTHGSQEIAQIEFIKTHGENVFPEFLKSEDFTNLEDQPTKFFSSL